jgi:hypothetical protein
MACAEPMPSHLSYPPACTGLFPTFFGHRSLDEAVEVKPTQGISRLGLRPQHPSAVIRSAPRVVSKHAPV